MTIEFRHYCTHCGHTANWLPSPGGIWYGGNWEHADDHSDICLPLDVDLEVRKQQSQQEIRR